MLYYNSSFATLEIFHKCETCCEDGWPPSSQNGRAAYRQTAMFSISTMYFILMIIFHYDHSAAIVTIIVQENQNLH